MASSVVNVVEYDTENNAISFSNRPLTRKSYKVDTSWIMATYIILRDKIIGGFDETGSESTLTFSGIEMELRLFTTHSRFTTHSSNVSFDRFIVYLEGVLPAQLFSMTGDMVVDEDCKYIIFNSQTPDDFMQIIAVLTDLGLIYLEYDNIKYLTEQITRKIDISYDRYKDYFSDTAFDIYNKITGKTTLPDKIPKEVGYNEKYVLYQTIILLIENFDHPERNTYRYYEILNTLVEFIGDESIYFKNQSIILINEDYISNFPDDDEPYINLIDAYLNMDPYSNNYVSIINQYLHENYKFGTEDDIFTELIKTLKYYSTRNISSPEIIEYLTDTRSISNYVRAIKAYQRNKPIN